MTAYCASFPDPTPEPAPREHRLYDVTADVVLPDGTVLAAAGDVVNEAVRCQIDDAMNGRAERYYYRLHAGYIPFDGRTIIRREWFEEYIEEHL